MSVWLGVGIGHLTRKPYATWHIVGGGGGKGKGKVLGRSSELQRNRDPYLSLTASLPARGVTDTLAPRTLRSDPTGIRTKHL